MIKKYTYKNITARHQAGLSLIELMISMIVGLFLLAGVVTNFISTKNSDVKRVAVSEMDANATVAFEVLRQTISHAGYVSVENIASFDKPFHTKSDIPSISNPKCGDGSTKRDVNILDQNFHTRDLDATGRDFLTIVTLADNPCMPGKDQCTVDDGTNVSPKALVYTDCLGGGSTRDARSVSCSTDPDKGMSDPTDAKIYSTFKLFKGADVNTDRVLYCYGSRSIDGEPIINNVEAIQYLYGVKEDGTGKINFRKAFQVEDKKQWAMVHSVKVGLLLRSSNNYVLDQESTKTSYKVLDQSITIPSTDKRRLFRVYTTTINLENKNKGALLPDG